MKHKWGAFDLWIGTATLTAVTLILLFSPSPLWSQASEPDCTAEVTDGDTLTRIQTRACIVVGVIDNHPPFSDRTGDEWQGFEVALAKQLAQTALGTEGTVLFQNLGDRTSRLSRLDTGEVDLVIATLPADADLADQVDFSESYLQDRLILLAAQDNPIGQFTELDGEQVAVFANTFLRENLERTFTDTAFVLTSSRSAEILRTALEAGNYRAIAGSEQALATVFDLDAFAVFPVEEYDLGYRIAVAQGDAALLTWVNCTLATMSTTTAWADLFSTLPAPAAPTALDLPASCQTTGTATDAETAPATPPPAAEPSTVQLIKERGYLIAGVKADVPLFGYQEADGSWSGFEVDLMREFAKRWLGDSENNDEDKDEFVEFVRVVSADRIDRLLDGDVDLLAATMTHNKGRDEIIDFSQTYFLDGQNLLVRADAEAWPDTDTGRVQLLEGKQIAAIRGSTSINRILEFARENGVIIEIAEFDQYDQALEALMEGTVDGITTDRGILAGLAIEQPELMILLEENFSNEPYGMGVRPGNSTFVDLINHTLQGMKEDGTYDDIYNEWFCRDETSSDCEDPYLLETLPGDPPFSFAEAPITSTVVSQCGYVIDTMIEENSFIAGVKADAPPFGYRDEETGEFIGFEVELMREFARRWLGDENAVDFAAVTSDNRFGQLNDCNIDIIAATMTHSKPRDALIDFGITYYLDGQNILVRRDAGLRSGNDSERLQALDGLRIGAVRGSTSIERIQAYATANGADVEIAEFDQYDQAVEPLLDGIINGLTTDRGILIGIAQQHPELVVLLDEDFSREPYGLGVREGDHRFRDLVNFTLQEMKEDGTYDLLYRYWFGISFIMQEEGLSTAERADLIQRYWTEDPDNPVTEWQPYAIELWPGSNYFQSAPGATISTRNDLAPMVFVPGGEGYLGTTRALATDLNQHPGRNAPQLFVEVDDFYIDQHEVTNHQYRQCVDLGLCEEPDELDILDAEYFYAEEYKNHPVVHITWEQAEAYCSAFGKTLPTEAQWERAARFGADEETNYLYPWGDEDANIALRATYADSEYRQEYANPVGIYRFQIPAPIHGFDEPLISLSGSSPLGVLDMSGSVQEWTADCYEQQYYSDLAAGPASARRNPTTRNSCGPEDERTVRSSGYYDRKYTLPTIFRQGKAPDSTDLLRGFRCVAPVEQAPVNRLFVAE